MIYNRGSCMRTCHCQWLSLSLYFPSCVITYFLSLYLQFCLTYPLATLCTLIKVISLIPLLFFYNPFCLLSSFHSSPASFPALPPFLSILSGRSLPGVIHLSLLTWPPTGLLGRQVLRGEDNGCWGPRGKQQTLFSVMVTYLRTAKTLGICFAIESLGKYKQARADCDIARCKEDCREITQRNVFKIYLHFARNFFFLYT